ncbi:hypothetical protein BDV95DRAFT_579765 [Massariosphaeria phaeospora]|uniref:Uncharacterized protein n=1 Tax=Massariosphaeria phaeospora TaxID=100035 RepID=A0A7C8I1K6_9PLEO|nr:hypothetical protein BDV95DRAFT_579765 [Massariosphaeria phaeospora]
MIDVFHQLHCLNLLRQATWLPYYRTHTHIVRTPAPFSDSDVGIRLHLDHCIETLRLTLMCHGDTTPSLMMEDPESPLGVSTDFSSHRMCRNFEGIREWTRENQIVGTKAMEWEPEKN